MSTISRLSLFVLLLLSQELHAWSTTASHTLSEVMSLNLWVISYRTEHDKLPAEREFRAAMADENEMPSNLRTDHWKNEFVYRVPGKQGEYDLYSRGENGIDDGGTGDDITASEGVRDGYYWKSHWPIGRRILYISVGGLLAVVVLRLFRPGTLAAPLLGLCCSGAIAWGSLLLMHPGRVPSHNTPLLGSFFAGVLITLLFAISLARKFRLQRMPRS